MCWDPQTLKAPRHSGCQGSRTILPKSTEISPLSWSDHTQMVFTCSYLTLKRFSNSIFLSLVGKIRRLLEQSMAPLKVENKPFLEPKPPRSSFSTQRSSHYVTEPLPAPARWPLGGARNESKHIPDTPGKMGFGKRMFVQNLPKIESQEEEEATS